MKSVRTGAQDYLIKGQIDSSLLSRSLSYAIERAGLLRVVQQELIERKVMERMLRKVNRALRMLSECNEIVVRATEENVLAEKICGAITAVGDYEFAWVAFTGPDDAKSIHPIAIVGSKDGNPPDEASVWFKRDPESPLSEALKTGKVVVCDDVTVDKRCSNLKTEADKLGYRSFLILPLVTCGKILGVVQICSREPDRFDREELKLLNELKEDVAYAIVSIRTEKERRRAEEALRDSEQKFRTIFDKASDGMFLVDLKAQKFFICNATCANMLGYAQEEFSNLDVPDVHPKEELSFIFEQMGKFSRGEDGIRSDIRFKRKDGSILVADLSPALLTIAENKYLLISFKDITERKRAEETVRDSEARYRALFQGTADGILIAEHETRMFRHANPAACRLLGYSEAELRTMGVTDIHPKADLPAVVDEFEAQARGEKTLAVGLPCLRKDGTIVHADVSAVSMTIDGRACNVGFFRDITERKLAELASRQAEDALRQQTAELKARNEELVRFNRAQVGREMRMVELKQQVNELCRQMGKQSKYPLDFLDAKPESSAGEETVEDRKPKSETKTELN